MAYKRIDDGRHLFYQLQLDKFLEELRRNGYRVGLDTHLQVQQLLLSLISNNEMPDSPMLLQPMLAAMVCSNEAEQQQFPHQYQSWLVQQNLAGKGKPAADVPVIEESERFQELLELAEAEEKWRFFAIVLAALIVLLALLGFNHSSQPQEFELSGLLQTEDGAPFANSPISFAGQDTTTNSFGKFRFTFTEAANSGYLRIDSTGYRHLLFAIPLRRSVVDTSLIAQQDIPIVQADSIVINPSTSLPDNLQPSSHTDEIHFGREWNWSTLLLYLLPVVLTFVGLGFYIWRRRFVLQRRPPRGEPTFEEWLLELSDANPLFMSAGMRRSSQELRRHLQRDFGRVDAEATITATLEAGGVLTPVFGREKVTPEYLLLRQRHGRNDQSDEWIKALIFRLKEQGIPLHNYEFSGSAGLCRDVDDPRSSCSIEELYSRYGHCRLLVFADADSMFNPLSGVALLWLQQLDDWQQKAIFVPPEQLKQNGWLPEALEEQDCLLFEANADGLEALVERLEKNDVKENGAQISQHSEWEEWIDPPDWLTSRTPPAQKQINHLLGKLKRWFNDDEAGYRWLAACAVFPLLRWELTIFLGEQLQDNGEMPLLSEKRLEKMVQLPWFRCGFLPDWLREALLNSLSLELDQEIRESICKALIYSKAGLLSGFRFRLGDNQLDSIHKMIFRQWNRLIGSEYSDLSDDRVFQDFIYVSPLRRLLFVLLDKKIHLSEYIRKYSVNWFVSLLFLLFLNSLFFIYRNCEQSIWSKNNRVILCVLPVEVDSKLDYSRNFAKGLLYSLTKRLKELENHRENLTVLETGDVVAEKVASIEQARERLKADMVITGLITGNRDRKEFIATVFETETNKQTNQFSIDVSGDRIIQIQENIAEKLRLLLDIELPIDYAVDAAFAGTGSIEAFEAYQKGITYLEEGRSKASRENAIRLFREAIRTDKNYVNAHAMLGIAYTNHFKVTKIDSFKTNAIISTRQALALEPNSSSARISLANVYIATRDFYMAILELQTVLKNDQNHAQAHRDLGNAYYYLSKLALAEEHYQAAIRLRPNYWEYYNALGFFYQSIGKHEEALQQYLQVLNLRPRYGIGHNNIGAQYEKLGTYAKALEYYKFATELTNDSPRTRAIAFSNWAGCLLRDQLYSESIKKYEKSRMLMPGSFAIWSNLAIAYELAGQLNNARSIRAEIIREGETKLDKLSVLEKQLFAEALAKSDRKRSAQTLLDEVIKDAPKNWRILFGISRVWTYLGNHDKALVFLEDSIKNGLRRPSVSLYKQWSSLVEKDERYFRLLRRNGLL